MTLLLLDNKSISHILSYCDGATIFQYVTPTWTLFILCLDFCTWWYTTPGLGQSSMCRTSICPTKPISRIKSWNSSPNRTYNFLITRMQSIASWVQCSLASISLINCGEIGSDALKCLSTNVRSVNLSGCKKIRDSSLKVLKNELYPHLESLNLSYVPVIHYSVIIFFLILGIVKLVTLVWKWL